MAEITIVKNGVSVSTNRIESKRLIIKIAGIFCRWRFKPFGSDKLQQKLGNGSYLGVVSAKKLQPFVDELKIVVPRNNKKRQKSFAILII